MVSKIKYAGVFFLTIGYMAKINAQILSLSQANTVMTVGLLLITAYSVAKFLGK
ncbi:hypothetical protein N8376_00120 [Flavobacteriaceae bacterium]|nr:hypothetical protein [Flavobacteriaceae bacterium]MDC1491749.1 hypothetical protein [Flavobacteriaceae bacterium]